MGLEKVKLELSEEQAEYMVLCNKYFKQIKRLYEANVFELKSGRAILDFDGGGEIQNIQKVLNYHFRVVKIL